MECTQKTPAAERSGRPAAQRFAASNAATVVDNRPKAVAPRELADTGHDSTRTKAQQASIRAVLSSSRVVAQARRLDGLFKVAQLRPDPANASYRPLRRIAVPAMRRLYRPPAGPTIQRIIEVVGDRVYGEGEAQELKDNYPTEWEQILASLIEARNRPRSIEAALADPRHWVLTRDVDPEYGVQWIYNMKAEEKAVIGGGKTREAGKEPVVVTRPLADFEELRIKGLIMCVGVLIEARGREGITAVAGSHFVTPDCVKDSAINELGKGLMAKQVDLVRPHGPLQAILMPTDGASTMKTKPQKDAQEAVTLLTAFLKECGVEAVAVSEGPSERTYQLLPDGGRKFAL